MMKVVNWALALCVLGTTLAGCSTLGVEHLKPGQATIEQFRAREKPSAEWKNTDGTLTLEYDARPDSDQNLMFDFDGKGKLVAMRYAITLENMERLKPAMTHMEVKRILGNPRNVSVDGMTGGEIWEWPLEGKSTGIGQPQIQILWHPRVDAVVSISRTVRFPGGS